MQIVFKLCIFLNVQQLREIATLKLKFKRETGLLNPSLDAVVVLAVHPGLEVADGGLAVALLLVDHVVQPGVLAYGTRQNSLFPSFLSIVRGCIDGVIVLAHQKT